jgi:hypothetical protein
MSALSKTYKESSDILERLSEFPAYVIASTLMTE